MVLPFFGKKSSGSTKTDAQGGQGALEHTTTADFTQVSDVNRSLAAAAKKIKVQQASVDDMAAVEEAAILYANANEEGAQAVLEEAVLASQHSERLWRMLFDLYRLVGERAAFDSQGVVFAQLFEKSPPVWDADTSAPRPGVRVTPSDKAPTVNLSGALNAAARTQLDQLLRIAAKTGKIRIDLSRLRSIDETGAGLLSETLDKLKRAKTKTTVFGVAHSLSLVEPQLKVGEPTARPFWLAALAVVQQMGDPARFEDMAINFAITFEESPPSWDPLEADEAATETDTADLLRAEESHTPAGDVLVLEGTINGPQPEILGELAEYAAERNFIEIDASHLKRLEFVSAGTLFNQIAQFQTQGKRTIILHPNEMVAALMAVMGIDQIARIEHKKF